MRKFDINLYPSKTFITLILLTLLGSTAIALTLPLNLWLILLLVTIVATYGAHILYCYGLLRHKNSIIKLVLTTDGWQVSDNRSTYHATLCGSSTATTKLCVLKFVIAGKKLKKSCVIFKDSVTSGYYRKLLAEIRP